MKEHNIYKLECKSLTLPISFPTFQKKAMLTVSDVNTVYVHLHNLPFFYIYAQNI